MIVIGIIIILIIIARSKPTTSIIRQWGTTTGHWQCENRGQVRSDYTINHIIIS